MDKERKLRSIAASFQPNDQLEELLRLHQRNRVEFDRLPISERMKVGHYANAKAAYNKLQQQEARHGNQ